MTKHLTSRSSIIILLSSSRFCQSINSVWFNLSKLISDQNKDLKGLMSCEFFFIMKKNSFQCWKLTWHSHEETKKKRRTLIGKLTKAIILPTTGKSGACLGFLLCSPSWNAEVVVWLWWPGRNSYLATLPYFCLSEKISCKGTSMEPFCSLPTLKPGFASFILASAAWSW